MHILSIDRNKSTLQISGKVAGGVREDSRNFSGVPIYWAHRAVVFAIARLSCFLKRSPQQEEDQQQQDKQRYGIGSDRITDITMTKCLRVIAVPQRQTHSSLRAGCSRRVQSAHSAVDVAQ